MAGGRLRLRHEQLGGLRRQNRALDPRREVRSQAVGQEFDQSHDAYPPREDSRRNFTRVCDCVCECVSAVLEEIRLGATVEVSSRARPGKTFQREVYFEKRARVCACPRVRAPACVRARVPARARARVVGTRPFDSAFLERKTLFLSGS